MSNFKFSLSPDVAAAFVRALDSTLCHAGFERIIDYLGPEGLEVAQYRREQTVIAVDQRGAGDDSTAVTVDTEIDAVDLARRAGAFCVAEIMADVFAPLSRLQPSELRSVAQAVVQAFAEQVSQETRED